MAIETPHDLLTHELYSIKDAETQAAEALQALLSEAEDEQLRSMIERRLEQGERLLEEIEDVLDDNDSGTPRPQNEAAHGLIQQTQRLLTEVQSPELKHTVMIGGMQKLEHYCIATWGTVKAIAREAGDEETEEVMQRALDEGYELDSELTELAESRVNPEAMESGEHDGSEQAASAQGGKAGAKRQSQSEGRGRP